MVVAISIAISALVGLATGYFFERRELRDARWDREEALARASQLEVQLTDLRQEVIHAREAVYAGARATGPTATPLPSPDLEVETLALVRACLNAEGRVLESQIVLKLLSRGECRSVINTAIDGLLQSRQVARDDGWLVIE